MDRYKQHEIDQMVNAICNKYHIIRNGTILPDITSRHYVKFLQPYVTTLSGNPLSYHYNKTPFSYKYGNIIEGLIRLFISYPDIFSLDSFKKFTESMIGHQEFIKSYLSEICKSYDIVLFHTDTVFNIQYFTPKGFVRNDWYILSFTEKTYNDIVYLISHRLTPFDYNFASDILENTRPTPNWGFQEKGNQEIIKMNIINSIITMMKGIKKSHIN